MATNGIYSASSVMRLSGLSGGSGLDTETIVKQLMTVERIPLDKLYQKKQLIQWRQDAYREITNKLRDLKDSYFNSTKPASSLMNPSSFMKYSGTSSNSAYVTVSGGTNSTPGSHTVSVISVASGGKAVSNAGVAGSPGVTDPLTGNVSDLALSGKKIRITLDGVTREITLNDYSGNDETTINQKLQALVDDAFGLGKNPTTGDPESKIVVKYVQSTGTLSFDTAGGASRITLGSGTSNDALASLGFTPGASNRLDINRSLDSLKESFANENGLTFNADGKLIFSINNIKFTFDKTVTLSSMMNTISADPDAKVTMKYDEMTDKFTLTAKQFGYGDNIIIDQDPLNGNFFGANSASGINTGSATTEQGSDASAMIDGQLVTRNSNTFTLNGVTYTLVKAHSDPAKQSETVSLSVNTDDVFNNIKGFVDKYNDLIFFINTKLTDKYERDYQPLTDDQKASMKDEDIKAWEAKAKTGLLNGDPILQNIVTSMRRALYENISDISTRLSTIGITSGAYYEKGKLTIDENKLRAAIQNDPDSVTQLFTKQAAYSYNATTNSPDLRTIRYNTEGLANRFSDILDDTIRTAMGKGTLLQKAGIPGDSSEYNNTIYSELGKYDKDIKSMITRLSAKENSYYVKFTALEKYMSKMNAQSSWLSSQLGGLSSNR